MGISRATFYRMYAIWLETGDVIRPVNGRRGRPRILHFSDVDYLKRLIQHRPNWFLNEHFLPLSVRGLSFRAILVVRFRPKGIRITKPEASEGSSTTSRNIIWIASIVFIFILHLLADCQCPGRIPLLLPLVQLVLLVNLKSLNAILKQSLSLRPVHDFCVNLDWISFF